jgi:hypothetical protein
VIVNAPISVLRFASETHSEISTLEGSTEASPVGNAHKRVEDMGGQAPEQGNRSGEWESRSPSTDFESATGQY